MKYGLLIATVLLMAGLMLSGCRKDTGSSGDPNDPGNAGISSAVGDDKTDQSTNNGDENREDTSASQTEQEDEEPVEIIDDSYRNYYEIFVYSFYDSDGDGYGDLNGVTGKLDYVADMGYTGIWFMPVHPSPTYHIYDISDYYGIDS